MSHSWNLFPRWIGNKISSFPFCCKHPALTFSNLQYLLSTFFCTSPICPLQKTLKLTTRKIPFACLTCFHPDIHDPPICSTLFGERRDIADAIKLQICGTIGIGGASKPREGSVHTYFIGCLLLLLLILLHLKRRRLKAYFMITSRPAKIVTKKKVLSLPKTKQKGTPINRRNFYS